MKSVLFPHLVFSISICLYSVLMVKLNCINQKACLINWVLQFYSYQILFSIIIWILFEWFHYILIIKSISNELILYNLLFI